MNVPAELKRVRVRLDGRVIPYVSGLDEASTSEQVLRLRKGGNEEYPDHVPLIPVGCARRWTCA